MGNVTTANIDLYYASSSYNLNKDSMDILYDAALVVSTELEEIVKEKENEHEQELLSYDILRGWRERLITSLELCRELEFLKGIGASSMNLKHNDISNIYMYLLSYMENGFVFKRYRRIFYES